MNQSHDIKEESCAQDANSLSTSFAELLPVGADDVSPFIREVALALGETEADLARRLGVSHATLSTWKRRGSIPEPHLEWFSNRFVPHVFRNDPDKMNGGFQHGGLAIALAVFKQTDFDPYRNLYGSEILQVEICFRNLSPISRLGLFVQNRLGADRGDTPGDTYIWCRIVPKVIELARLGTRTPFYI